MNKQKLIIATRQSPLAMQQAETIRQALLKVHPHLTIALLGLTTQGDRHLVEVNQLAMGGKDAFVKELEEALLDGRADIAVHSMKDVPMVLPDGLVLPVIAERADPRDVFVSTHFTRFDALPKGARVGTASLRRQTQLRVLRPDLQFLPLRGNIQTRLQRLDAGHYDAIVLAAAGLLRMQLSARIRHYFSTEDCLPAAGQGALGLECRAGDTAIHSLIAPLNHLPTAQCVTAERAMCRYLGGGCKVPIAAFARRERGLLQLTGMIAAKDSSNMFYAHVSGSYTKAESVGIDAAEELLELEGAEDVLRSYASDEDE